MKYVEYQETAINEIAETALRFLNDKYREASTIIFKSSYRSGKTYMIISSINNDF